MPSKQNTKPTSDNPAHPDRGLRTRKERKFPALTFEEAMKLPQAIQEISSGQKVRRLTLFEKLNQSPDSKDSRRLITGSGQYGLTKGSYNAEYLELTAEGAEATGEDVPLAKSIGARFSLGIKNQPPFDFLYTKLKGNKMPAKEVMADFLAEANIEEDERFECIDTFILNAKFLGLLRTIAGSERLVPVEQVLEEVPANGTSIRGSAGGAAEERASEKLTAAVNYVEVTDDDFAKVCFYITPIGESGTEERQHADFMMEYIIKPAVKEFGLKVVRADQMGKPGMIGKQVIEHIFKARLVVADLSFHNPNVFYELCLRHATRLPTVQIKRELDRIPFDLNQYRTISIETRNPYTLYPQIQTHTAEVANQVRRALQDSESGDNPISLYYPSAKLNWSER